MYGVDHCHMLEDRICALDAELARLRAANARLRACCQAWEAWDKASYRYHDPDNFEDNLYADLRRTHDARDAARHAVDEAGDLRGEA